MWDISKIASFLSDSLTIAVSIIALVTFIKKRKTISEFFQFVIKYSFQSTFHNLTSLIDKTSTAIGKNENSIAYPSLAELVGTLKGCSNLGKNIMTTANELEELLNAGRKPGKQVLGNDALMLLSKLRQELLELNVLKQGDKL